MPTLRETKKARTRAELQAQALRLFADRGYEATTVDDIAAASGTSRSTFFRYFATKEDVVLFDDADAAFLASLSAQPPGRPLLEALILGVEATFRTFDPARQDREELRMELVRTIPEVRRAQQARDVWHMEQVASMVATALQRDAADPEVLIFAGVFTGVRLAAQVAVMRSPGAYVETTLAMLHRLHDGIPLATAPIAASAGSAALISSPDRD